MFILSFYQLSPQLSPLPLRTQFSYSWGERQQLFLLIADVPTYNPEF